MKEERPFFHASLTIVAWHRALSSRPAMTSRLQLPFTNAIAATFSTGTLSNGLAGAAAAGADAASASVIVSQRILALLRKAGDNSTAVPAFPEASGCHCSENRT